MSETPRTDEQINGKPCTQFGILAGDSLRNAAVPSEFARGLERELNAANQRIKRMEEAGDAVAAIIGPPGSAHWADEDQVDSAWNNWREAKEAKP